MADQWRNPEARWDPAGASPSDAAEPASAPPPPRAAELSAAAASAPAGRSLLLQAATYPTVYTWYVFLSSLDIMFTWVVLHAGGREENVLADWIIQQFNLPGLVLFKFCLVVLVVLICEVVGRRNATLGRTLGRWILLISAFPVAVGGSHVLRILMTDPAPA